MNENQIDSYINLINSQIDKFNLSISRGADGHTGDTYYALHCISENNITKLSTIYTPEQLEVLKAALEMIITKNGRFKSKQIVKAMLLKNVKFPTMKDIYATIEEFVKEKYFQEIENHYYILPRGLIEFNTYFRSYYREFVVDCALCKTIAIRPQTCKHCKAPLHKACAERYASQQEQIKCINCNNSFELNESIDSIRSEDANTTVPNGTSRVANWLDEQQDQDSDAESDAESDAGSLEEAMEVVQSQAV